MEEIQKLPNHVAIILDGNGRWAQQRGLPRSAGHKAGAITFKKLSLYILKKGIPYLSIFAFSTENFKRSEEEINCLMKLFLDNFKKEIKTYQKAKIKVIFSGRKEPLKEEIWNAMQNIMEETKEFQGKVLNICLNYGGQAEIIDTTKKLIQQVQNHTISMEEINEELFRKNLYQDLPPIDFLIRTSGEERISNFMLWQAAYAEFYFPNIYFPDFHEQQFDEALLVYNKRNRRFGGVQNESKNP